MQTFSVKGHSDIDTLCKGGNLSKTSGARGYSDADTCSKGLGTLMQTPSVSAINIM